MPALRSVASVASARLSANTAQVSEGALLVARAGTSSQRMETAVGRLDALILEMARPQRRPDTHVAEAAQARGRIDPTTLRNTALVEEIAASTVGLHEQAGALVRAVALFRGADGHIAGRSALSFTSLPLMLPRNRQNRVMPRAPSARLVANPAAPSPAASTDYSTLEVARMLGMAVRSVQLMVDRGELHAWKTPGGHRRISRASVQAWIAGRSTGARHAPEQSTAPTAPAPHRPRLLLIEDSVHYQNLVALLVAQQFPDVELHVARDGIVGLAMVGQLQPELLLVDILLPGIDGATLITSLRSQAQFAHSRLIVVTSLDERQRAPFAFALEGVPVVHKPDLVTALPPLITSQLALRP